MFGTLTLNSNLFKKNIIFLTDKNMFKVSRSNIKSVVFVLFKVFANTVKQNSTSSSEVLLPKSAFTCHQ